MHAAIQLKGPKGITQLKGPRKAQLKGPMGEALCCLHISMWDQREMEIRPKGNGDIKQQSEIGMRHAKRD